VRCIVSGYGELANLEAPESTRGCIIVAFAGIPLPSPGVAGKDRVWGTGRPRAAKFGIINRRPWRTQGWKEIRAAGSLARLSRAIGESEENVVRWHCMIGSGDACVVGSTLVRLCASGGFM
jgi:hypothetical protein